VILASLAIDQDRHAKLINLHGRSPYA